MSTHAERERLVEYLLGNLSEDERLEIERQYFKDDDAFEALLAVENELAYDYAAGTLSTDERQRFEQRFLRTADQRARVATARALLGKSAERSVRARARPPWLLAAAAVLAVAVAGWIAIQFTTPPDHSDRAAVTAPPATAPGTGAAPAVEPPSSVPQPPPDAARPAPDAVVLAMTLRPGLVRGTDGGTRIVVPSSARVLRLQLVIPATVAASYRSYRVAIRNADGVEIWSGAPVVEARPLSIEVPAPALAAGDYELVLSGATTPAISEDIAEYYFSVVRR